MEKAPTRSVYRQYIIRTPYPLYLYLYTYIDLYIPTYSQYIYIYIYIYDNIFSRSLLTIDLIIACEFSFSILKKTHTLF